MSSVLPGASVPPASPLTRRAVIRYRLTRLVPGCLLLGAAAELFMINTGFYNVAKRKEVERKVERLSEQQLYWQERRQREEAQRSTAIEPTAAADGKRIS